MSRSGPGFGPSARLAALLAAAACTAACGGTDDDPAVGAGGNGATAAGGAAAAGGGTSLGGTSGGGTASGGGAEAACPTGGPASTLPEGCPDVSCRPLFPFVGPWLYGQAPCALNPDYLPPLVVRYEGGRPVALVDDDGAPLETYEYDTAGRLIGYREQHPGEPPVEATVDYRSNGEVVVTREVQGSDSSTHVYLRDARGYPVSVETGTTLFRYDYEGCRLATRTPVQGSGTGTEGLSYEHDAAGNIAAIGETTYSYSCH